MYKEAHCSRVYRSRKLEATSVFISGGTVWLNYIAAIKHNDLELYIKLGDASDRCL